MDTSLDLGALADRLRSGNLTAGARWPGDAVDRQPVHTIYGGAHLYAPGVHRKLGQLALAALDAYAPDFATFAQAVAMPGADGLPTAAAEIASLDAALARWGDDAAQVHEPAWRARTIYQRVRAKLAREPIEDQRIDFEDGYGHRRDDEEDGHAVGAGTRLAEAVVGGDVPPFLGVRIKPLTEESKGRALRTLDLFVGALVRGSGGRLPPGFVVTLPKITGPHQVAVLAEALDALEAAHGLPAGAIGLDLMIETTQSIFDADGRVAPPGLVAAGRGRVRSVAFGTYDYTAGCNITAAFQTHTHAACDFARHIMQVSLAGSGVALADGATTVMPIGPHRAGKGETLSASQVAENRAVVHAAWRLHFANVYHSLAHGYYQGWDLNPGQLPVRYAAVYAFFLQGLADASARLDRFVAAASQATLSGNTFDDAATGQGLLNYFLRGLACGALTEAEVLATGITLDELRGRSFARIVANRAHQRRQDA